VDRANHANNVDMMQIQRGCVRLDHGVANLIQRVNQANEPVIAVDPGK
jgi:hypothetical protein